MVGSKSNFKRRRSTRRPMTRKRRFVRRSTIPRSIGNPNQKVYFFKRHAVDEPLLAVEAVPGTITDTLSTYDFTLASVPNYTEFTHLFDFYKINRVVFQIWPRMSGNFDTSFNAATSTVSDLRLFTAIDYNDNSAPASVNIIRTYPNCKVTRFMNGQKRALSPKYNDPDNIVEWKGKNPWISTANPTVPHYALKVGVDMSNFNAANVTDGATIAICEVIYYLSFKQPRSSNGA